MQTQQIAPQRNPVREIRAYLETDAVQSQLAKVLPAEMRPDRMARVAVTAMTKNPKLLECTHESVLQCMMECSAFGLEPDGRHAHLIPYKNTCTLIIDWKGLVALARRSGSVSLFKAELVCANDHFEWANGRVDHRIDWRSKRGEVQLVYSYVQFKDGAEDWEVMTLEEVNAIRRRSRSANAGPWVSDFEEMAKKTAIRRHSKRLTLSPEFQRAVERDDGEIELRDVTPKARTQVLPPPHMRDLPPPDPEPDQQDDVGNGDEWDGERGDEGGAA